MCGLCFLNDAGEVVRSTQESELFPVAPGCCQLRKEDEKDVDSLETFITLVVSRKGQRFFDSIAHFIFIFPFLYRTSGGHSNGWKSTQGKSEKVSHVVKAQIWNSGWNWGRIWSRCFGTLPVSTQALMSLMIAFFQSTIQNSNSFLFALGMSAQTTLTQEHRFFPE